MQQVSESFVRQVCLNLSSAEKKEILKNHNEE